MADSTLKKPTDLTRKIFADIPRREELIVNLVKSPTDDETKDPEWYCLYRTFVNRAVEAFGDEFEANKWLTTQQLELNNQCPVEAVTSSSFPAAYFEPLFSRLEHGVFA